MYKYIIILFAVVFLTANPVKLVADDERIDNRASIIDNYYTEHNMLLKGYGKKLVEVADKNGLDWRLLPAISIRETSGGNHQCRLNNSFGWGSCKIQFKTTDESIEVIGYKLANLSVYKGASTEHKLYHYNGTVVKTYPQEVIKIMNQISNTIKPL